MGTVTIGTTAWTIYGTHKGAGSATEYLAASIAPAARTWAGLEDDDEKRTLVSATRVLDEQTWAGQKTVPSQAQQWPRTGVFRKDGTAVDSATVPQEIIDGSYELAALLAEDASILKQTDGASNISSVSTGLGVSMSFFRRDKPGRFPVSVMDLVGQFFPGISGVAANSTSAASQAFGVGDADNPDQVSAFDQDSGYDLERSL
jgi:hypothetical protein